MGVLETSSSSDVLCMILSCRFLTPPRSRCFFALLVRWSQDMIASSSSLLIIAVSLSLPRETKSALRPRTVKEGKDPTAISIWRGSFLEILLRNWKSFFAAATVTQSFLMLPYIPWNSVILADLKLVCVKFIRDTSSWKTSFWTTIIIRKGRIIIIIASTLVCCSLVTVLHSLSLRFLSQSYHHFRPVYTVYISSSSRLHRHSFSTCCFRFLKKTNRTDLSHHFMKPSDFVSSNLLHKQKSRNQ